jgi:cysteinyl-tRNA synthetase
LSLRIYNTLTRQKEPFVPLVTGRVGVYVCGITPYDASHIGHARSALVFDVVVRYLRFRGYQVTFVKNYTDVDDKIIARANQLKASVADPVARIGELAAPYIKAYEADMGRLGVAPPTLAPRATGHIPEMVALIERLVAAGVAYVVDGDVYFEVMRFPAYGRLSGKNLDELLAGARVDVNERKRDPRDFALWKAAKPGEPSWPSPWGPGRPGWHIECSAMAMKYLGETLDLHGGGEDLIFPHHSCEIAQSEAATGKPFARVWVHNGFVNLGAEKMSKSLGNTLTVEALLKRHDPEALRLYLLQTHYRNPVEFSEEGVAGIRRPLERFGELVDRRRELVDRYRELVDVAGALIPTEPETPPDGTFLTQVGVLRERFESAMDDDFNTPQAIASLNQLAAALIEERKRIDTAARSGGDFVKGVDVLITLGKVLGLSMEGHHVKRAQVFEPEHHARIDALVEARTAARKQRDWARADALRAELDALGVLVEDTPAGPKWKLKAGTAL